LLSVLFLVGLNFNPQPIPKPTQPMLMIIHY
jgi:hypothetical protein